MGLIFWWMLPLWAVLAAGFVGVWWWRQSRQHGGGERGRAVPIAHSSRLTALPAYAAALKQYRWLVLLSALAVVLVVLASVLLSARPAKTALDQTQTSNRDIMLCLDISGSMTTVDGNLAATFAHLSKDFKGERIGLTVFDSSASSIFPLTDDYDFVQSSLASVAKQLEGTDYGGDIYSGVYEGNGSSLIGDGLASCLLRFDNLTSKRSRSVILATDNEANGEQIINLTQAGALAKQKGIRVYGVNPSDSSTADFPDPNAQEFRAVTAATDGAYYKIDYGKASDAATIASVVSKITAQEATRFIGAPHIARSDAPAAMVFVGLFGVSALSVLLWRLEV